MIQNLINKIQRSSLKVIEVKDLENEQQDSKELNEKLRVIIVEDLEDRKRITFIIKAQKLNY